MNTEINIAILSELIEINMYIKSIEIRHAYSF